MKPTPLMHYLIPAAILLSFVGIIRVARTQSQIGQLLPKAQAGDQDAQYQVARILYLGLESRPDKPSSMRWACEAAWQGNALAQSMLARLYGSGVDSSPDVPGFSLPKNVETAFYWATVSFRAAPQAVEPPSPPASSVSEGGLTKKKKKKAPDELWIAPPAPGSPSPPAGHGTAAGLRSSYSKELTYEQVIAIEEDAVKFAPIKSNPWVPSGKCDNISEGMLFKKK